MRALRTPFAAGLAIALAASTAHAQYATGTWSPAYGAPIVVQTTQSTESYPPGGRAESNGYQLDAAYGYIDANALHLLLTGNILMAWNIEGQTVWSNLDVFLDTRPGGQSALLANNPVVDPYWFDLTTMTGLRFDAGFEPDWWFGVDGSSTGCCGTYYVRTAMAELPTAGGGTGSVIGERLIDTSGPVANGTNPYGVSLAVVDTNSAGVTLGCGPWSGPEIRTGIELVIPLAAIGNPTGCIRVCAFDAKDNSNLSVSNQVLGPLPPGTCDLGPSGAVDFSAIPGAQWFSICPGATPARQRTWGALKTSYR